MTANQFSKRRKKLFKTQWQAAEALGVTPQACSMWENGRREVPLWVVKFLQCLEKQDFSLDRPAGMVDNKRV